MHINAHGQSDVGRVRQSNEDSLGIYPNLLFYVVADGMGGHAAGEVASRMAIETMQSFILSTAQSEEVTWPIDIDPKLPSAVRRLIAAGKLANDRITHSSRENPKLNGMGTTMVAILVEQDTAYVAHVGDSRAYLVRNQKIEQLTQDHSLVNDYLHQGLLKKEDADRHPLKHVITRALGSNPNVEVDVRTVSIKPRDIFILCSDGLSNLVTEEEIQAQTLQSQENPQLACQKLVDLANNKGGEDNITVACIRIQ